ncbi:hypothetical protein F5Y03DRAFT_400993 [Xylaria venustula]|nr:hypothetical protein F5Y03DRAFT_400993 [Xylaria venustula]
MRFPTLKTLSLFAILKRSVADWTLEAYKSGCPAADKYEPDVGFTAGTSSDELWCVGIASAHNVVATGIEDTMHVTLFSDPECQYAITDFDTDGCKVIPENTVIEAVRVLPK